MGDARGHWLAEVARRAGLLGPDSVVTAGVALPEAWAAVARACGIAENQLAARVASHYRLAVADLEAAEAPAVALVPEKAARRYLAFPVRARDRELVVAVADPTDLDAEQALGFASGRNIVNEVASPAAIQEAIDRRDAPDRGLRGMGDPGGAEPR